MAGLPCRRRRSYWPRWTGRTAAPTPSCRWSRPRKRNSRRCLWPEPSDADWRWGHLTDNRTLLFYKYFTIEKKNNPKYFIFFLIADGWLGWQDLASWKLRWVSRGQPCLSAAGAAMAWWTRESWTRSPSSPSSCCCRLYEKKGGQTKF